MSSEEVFEKVKNVIIEQLGVAENNITMEASFICLLYTSPSPRD